MKPGKKKIWNFVGLPRRLTLRKKIDFWNLTLKPKLEFCQILNVLEKVIWWTFMKSQRNLNMKIVWFKTGFESDRSNRIGPNRIESDRKHWIGPKWIESDLSRTKCTESDRMHRIGTNWIGPNALNQKESNRTKCIESDRNGLNQIELNQIWIGLNRTELNRTETDWIWFWNLKSENCQCLEAESYVTFEIWLKSDYKFWLIWK